MPKPRYKYDEAKIRELVKQGKRLTQISKELDIPASSVLQFMNYHKIPYIPNIRHTAKTTELQSELHILDSLIKELEKDYLRYTLFNKKYGIPSITFYTETILEVKNNLQYEKEAKRYNLNKILHRLSTKVI